MAPRHHNKTKRLNKTEMQRQSIVSSLLRTQKQIHKSIKF